MAAAPDGSWLAYCSPPADSDGNGKLEASFGENGALSGDALALALAQAGRPPLALDAYLGSDARGRFVLGRIAGKVTLVDTTSGATLDLGARGADEREDLSGQPGHRAFTFAPGGERLGYLRQIPDGFEIVVRELESGAEQVFAAGRHEIHRIEFDAAGRRILIQAVTNDTNKNRRLDWPFPARRVARAQCASPLARLPTRYPTGDRTASFVLSLDDGSLREAPGLVTALAEGLVLREKNGELVLDGGGKRSLLASSKCGARVLHADPLRQLLLVACTAKGTPARAEVELVGRDYRKPLGVAVQPTELDARPNAQRLVPLYPGSDALLVDLERRAVHPLKPADLVVAVSGARALVLRGSGLVLVDVDEPRELELPVKVALLPDMLVQGSWAVVTPAVVDLDSGKLAGSYAGRPLSLSRSGQLLEAAGGSASAERFARGPLRWVDPAPPAATSE